MYEKVSSRAILSLILFTFLAWPLKGFGINGKVAGLGNIQTQDYLDDSYSLDGNTTPILNLYTNESVQNLSSDSLFYLKKLWPGMDTIAFVFVDTLTINSIFMPVIFSGKVTPQKITFPRRKSPYLKPAYIPKQPRIKMFGKELFTKELNRKAYLYYVFHNIDNMKYAKDFLPTDIPVASQIKVNPFKQIFQIDNDVDFTSSEPLEMSLPKRRYWTASFETSLQFSQNYISENWHKGGNSNFNLLSINKFNHEYEKERIKISTTVEYKLSIYTTPNDTLRSYRIADDAFSIINSYGYKAFSNWFYSLSLDVRTQLLSNYVENNTTKNSAFLSPITLNFSLGMEYKLTKEIRRHRKIELSSNISPFSYNMKYIKDDDVNRPRHGLAAGENFLKNLGSKSLTTFQFNIDRNITWNFKMNYFTNYEKVEAEFENTLNLAVSRFFSTRIYCDIRFDDSVKKADPSDSYFQFYEILSFGFNYKF